MTAPAWKHAVDQGMLTVVIDNRDVQLTVETQPHVHGCVANVFTNKLFTDPTAVVALPSVCYRLQFDRSAACGITILDGDDREIDEQPPEIIAMLGEQLAESIQALLEGLEQLLELLPTPEVIQENLLAAVDENAAHLVCDPDVADQSLESKRFILFVVDTFGHQVFPKGSVVEPGYQIICQMPLRTNSPFQEIYNEWYVHCCQQALDAIRGDLPRLLYEAMGRIIESAQSRRQQMRKVFDLSDID